MSITKIPDYVDDAYYAAMRGCFNTLVDNLIAIQGMTPACALVKKKEVVEKFRKCLQVHKEARDIYALLVQE